MPAPLSRLVRMASLGWLMMVALSILSRRAEGQELRDQYHQAPRDTVSQEVYDGWKQYNLNCARCHGEDVQGTTIAPHLVVSLKPVGPLNTKECVPAVPRRECRRGARSEWRCLPSRRSTRT
jgi:hypothetical protein